MDINAKPGTIRKLKLNDVIGATKICHSLHQANFTETVQLANALGSYPKITIFGIQPKNTKDAGILTPEVKKSVPILIDWLLKEVKK